MSSPLFHSGTKVSISPSIMSDIFITSWSLMSRSTTISVATLSAVSVSI
uniref:Uncharacterized protein n=1 Tax=Rhizophora mucronata TaxID=61149 RepID=A0A2P2R0F0_RHIMU